MHEKAFAGKESMQVLRKSGGYNSVVRVSVCGTESAGSIPAIRPYYLVGRVVQGQDRGLQSL